MDLKLDKEIVMEQTFQVQNVKCGGCANTLRKALEDEFGEVRVELRKEPREITLEIEDNQIEILREKLKSIGYPLADEDLNTLDTISTKAKSFVSCAIGKMDS
jgi:copper chaperone CopZ